MKLYIVTAFSILLSLSAGAEEKVLFSDNSKSPFQILEALYKNARPTKSAEMLPSRNTQGRLELKLFHTLEEPVFQETVRSEIAVSELCSYLVSTGGIPVKKDADPPLRGGGPLFPDKPAKSGISYRTSLVLGAAGCEKSYGVIATQDELERLALFEYKIEDSSDGLGMGRLILLDKTDRYMSKQVSFFRTYGNYIVEKIIYVRLDDKTGDPSKFYEAYNYYWKFEPKKNL